MVLTCWHLKLEVGLSFIALIWCGTSAPTPKICNPTTIMTGVDCDIFRNWPRKRWWNRWRWCRAAKTSSPPTPASPPSPPFFRAFWKMSVFSRPALSLRRGKCHPPHHCPRHNLSANGNAEYRCRWTDSRCRMIDCCRHRDKRWYPVRPPTSLRHSHFHSWHWRVCPILVT